MLGEGGGEGKLAVQLAVAAVEDHPVVPDHHRDYDDGDDKVRHFCTGAFDDDDDVE